MAFDANAFMQMEVEGKFETKYPVIPAGEYVARISKLTPRQQQNKETKETQTLVDIRWSIDDAGVRQATGLDDPSARQSIFLDVGPGGHLQDGNGKNIALGRLLEVLDLNGKRWRWDMLIGKVAKIKVEHSPNPKDPENPYANVTLVTKL